MDNDNQIRIRPEVLWFLEQCKTREYLSDMDSILRNCKRYISDLPESDIKSDLQTMLELAADNLIDIAEDYDIDIYEILEM